MAKTIRSVLRLLASAALGAFAVAVLFVGLSALTRGDGTSPTARAIPKIEFRFIPPEEAPTHEPTPSPHSPPPIEWPRGETPDGGLTRDDFEVAPIALLEPVVFTRSREERSLMLPARDADPQPTVRILPEYPPNARGDGWVLVQFDITPAGTVANATAIAAQPRGTFERAALRAIERWRYQPAVMDGRAVERRGLRVKLRFELERT